MNTAPAVQIKPIDNSGSIHALKRAAEIKQRGANLHNEPAYALDPKKVIIDFLANHADTLDISCDKLLVVTYRRPEKTAGGIIMTQSALDEDKFQGKAGLVVKIGSLAFKDDARINHGGFKADLHDWITYRSVHGYEQEFCGLHCRVLKDENVIMKVTDPTLIW